MKCNKAVLFTLLIYGSVAFAAHPLVSDDTGTQGKQKMQLEVTGELSRDREKLDDVETREKGAGLAAVFSVGLADNVDLVIGAPWVWSRVTENGELAANENGIGDLGLEIKWRFSGYKGFSLAVKPGMTIPTGSEIHGLGNGKISYGVTMIASQELAPITIHLNAAYTRNEFKLGIDKETNRPDIWHTSAAMTSDVTKNLQLVANVGTESNGYRGSHRWPAFILGGAIYSVTDNIDFDLGVKAGLNGPEPDISLLVGVAWRL